MKLNEKMYNEKVLDQNIKNKKKEIADLEKKIVLAKKDLTNVQGSKKNIDVKSDKEATKVGKNMNISK